MSSLTALNSPIAEESLDRKAAAQLRIAVLSGEVAPGSRVTGQAIAPQLALSRETVGVALHRLAAEGLIVQNICSRWEVMRLTAEDANEHHTLRASLEGLAGRLATTRLDEDGKKTLSNAFDALLAVANTEPKVDLADADLNLHRTIVEFSGSKRLIQHYRQVEGQLRMYIGSVNGLLPSPQAVAAAHQLMVDAMLSGSAKTAEALLTDHSVVYGEKLNQLLLSREASDG